MFILIRVTRYSADNDDSDRHRSLPVPYETDVRERSFRPLSFSDNRLSYVPRGLCTEKGISEKCYVNYGISLKPTAQ